MLPSMALLLALTVEPPPPPPPTLASLASQIATLQHELARLSRSEPCASVRPLLSTPFFYSGCNRNVKRNFTVSVETCQNGTLTAYNQSAASGLFDIAIAANVPTHDAWHFVCTFNPEQPHVATCTLTYEVPLRPEGPAWLQISFDNVTRAVPSDPSSACTAGSISMIGTYFYDALTNDAGVYAFKATPLGVPQHPHP